MAAIPDFTALANPALRCLRAYDPGHDIPALRGRFAACGGLLEMGSNENCYGPSQSVHAALAAQSPSLHRYPDPAGKALKSAIAATHGIDPAEIALGNGSHELLMQLAQVFAGPEDEVLVSRYCFAVYPIAAMAVGARLLVAEALPADADMPLGHDLAAMAAGIGARTKLVFFANPNNPTGTWFSSAELEAFMANVPAHVLVVADEAYIEYVTDTGLASALSLRNRYPNLIVSRTFSKAHGLAGLRAGYLVADPAIVRLIEPIRESFNLNTMALAAAEAALSDPAHLDTVRDGNASERYWLTAALSNLGLRVLPSQTNFLLVHFGMRAAAIERALFDCGVILRPMGGYGLGEYLRITICARAENQRLLDALQAVMA
jgi:histidinol-phosphate aminotransferase